MEFRSLPRYQGTWRLFICSPEAFRRTIRTKSDCNDRLDRDRRAWVRSTQPGIYTITTSLYGVGGSATRDIESLPARDRVAGVFSR
jgi:hypothetical protein